jgi:hypothetical protein
MGYPVAYSPYLTGLVTNSIPGCVQSFKDQFNGAQVIDKFHFLSELLPARYFQAYEGTPKSYPLDQSRSKK